MTTHAGLLQLFTLLDKVAVVTGGASGIGKATAMLLAEAGATVVIADRDINGAGTAAAEIGANAIAVEFDLMDDRSILQLFDLVSQKFERLDILVNNAAIYPKYRLEELTEPQWQEMQRINVWGCFVAMRAAARVMKASRNGGRIVNISSIGGARTAVNHQIAYNASKAALDSMTFSAAMEFSSDNILVNSILPGAVSPFEQKPKPIGHLPATGPLMDAGRILLGRPALPAEIAGPILMLVSAAGGYITGQTIIIDGGFSIS